MSEPVDPLASLRRASKARQAAWDAPPPEPEEEPLVARFTVALGPTTIQDRWALAQHLEDTALRTAPGVARGDNQADWVHALVGVLNDLAAAARDARGSKVTSAREAVDVVSTVRLSVKVPLNREARIKLHGVLKVARRRAGDLVGGPAVPDAVARIQAEWERFTFGPDGEPEEPPRRNRIEPPGMWTDV